MEYTSVETVTVTDKWLHQSQTQRDASKQLLACVQSHSIVVSPLMKADLQVVIEKLHPISLKEIIQFMKHLMEGLQCLHKAKVLHNDGKINASAKWW